MLLNNSMLSITEQITLRKKQIFTYVKKANYKKALILAQKLKKDFKGNVLAEAYYATVLGDYAEFANTKATRRFKKEAAKILLKSTKKLRGINLFWSSRIRNEYYYHSGQFKKQYLLGKELVQKSHDKGRYYTQGVGAANYAYELATKGKKKLSEKWARIAIAAWGKYTRHIPDYYNSYVHYALALGILSKFKESNQKLLKASKLSGKSLNYFEFKEVREKLARINGPNS